jgi:hypothetical protein
MGLGGQVIGGLVTVGVVMLAAPFCSLAQERIGIVTNVEGTATVARVALVQDRQLQFKDDVYVHDRIRTGERSLVRVLLGGKATVTARERSVLTITEMPGVATVELGEGRISVAVSKGMMKPGEVVQIKTPNAITAIRGTVVVAEVVPGATVKSTITVLRGLVDVTRLDAGRQVGRAVDVGALQSIYVTGARALMQPRAISPADARRLTSEFRTIPSTVRRDAAASAVERAVAQATQDVEDAIAASASRKTREKATDRDADERDVTGDHDGMPKEKKEKEDGKGKSKQSASPVGGSIKGGKGTKGHDKVNIAAAAAVLDGGSAGAGSGKKSDKK